MLDRLLKISSLSGAVLVFCGVLKLIVYYSAFDIKIVEFLSFSEIITSFLDDINLLMIYFLAMTIQSLPLLNYLHRKSKLNIEEFYNAILLFVYGRKYRFILFFIAIVIIIVTLILTSIISLNYFVIYVLIFCLIQSLTYLVMAPTEEGKIEISDSSTFIIFSIVIGSAISLLAQHDIIETKSGKVIASIRTSNELINCGDENLYLGKTDNFIFIRKSNESTICIPVAEVKQFEFR